MSKSKISATVDNHILLHKLSNLPFDQIPNITVAQFAHLWFTWNYFAHTIYFWNFSWNKQKHSMYK